MAKRKSSIVNRGINFGLLLLTFSHAIRLAVEGKFQRIIEDYTLGFARSPPDLNPVNIKARAAAAYGPVAAGFILFEVKKMAMKKFRF